MLDGGYRQKIFHLFLILLLIYRFGTKDRSCIRRMKSVHLFKFIHVLFRIEGIWFRTLWIKYPLKDDEF